MTLKRLMSYLGLAVLISTLLVLFSFQKFASARRGATQAADDLKACQVLASRIEAMKDLPAQAGLHAMKRGELDKQMEAAAQAAGLQPSVLVAISPDQPRQVGTTVYQEQSTDVLLKDVGLSQLIDFLYHLSVKNPELKVAALRLTAPRDSKEIGHWTIHVTVNYRFYAPPTRSLQG